MLVWHCFRSVHTISLYMVLINQYFKYNFNYILRAEWLTWCLGRPTIDGNTALGASSPANPALHIPEPLSTTKPATSSSSDIVVQ